MSRWGMNPGKSTGYKAAALSAATALAVTGAVVYPGFETADVDLNDGGVWVVNQSINKVGHLNYQSKVLDGGVLTPLPRYDLAQNAERVFVRNLEQASLTSIDPAMVQFTDDFALPANSTFSYGSEVVAVTDGERGIVYAARTDRLGEFASQDREPLLDAEGGALSAVGADDTVWAVDLAANRFRSYTPAADGAFEPGVDREVAGLSSLAEPQLSVVGDTAVVFDAASGDLLTSDGTTSAVVDPEGGKLQAPGADSDAVVVALANKLATVPLRGGEAEYRPLGSAGQAIQPVRVGGCTYAAWQGSAQYVRDCDDDAADDAATIPGLGGGAELAFRVNRDVVVLNDVATGLVWLVNDGMQVVDNWSDLEPPQGKGEAKKEDSKEITDAIELPNRTEENKRPIAKPDDFGVRAGRTTALPVLFNDVDPDGDLLVASLEGRQPSVGTLQRIYDGTGFQLVVPEDASGRTAFTYRASDGRGGEATGKATVRVVPPAENSAPVQERVTTLRVQQGGSVTQNILTDWSDPEGDDLQLLGGASKDNDAIRVRPDGALTFQDNGKAVGRKDITVQVSDGREGAQGRIVVEVLAKSTIPPIPATDHVVANVGEEVTFSPLQNDADPSGAGLRLANVDRVDGLDLASNADTGTVTLRGQRTGTFYAKYVATNGPSSAAGLIRIDVKDPARNTGNPVAVRDVALLPAGGDVLVNVLGNDSDPAGGVLVLTGAQVPRAAPFTVSVERNSFVRVADVRGLTEPTKVTYTVSNGSGVSTGEITVIPVPSPPRLDPPRPHPDTVLVRAGDVATVDVLDNDVHPNGAELTLRPDLRETDGIGEGSLVSVADDTVRFRAGAFDGKPRRVSVVYTVAGPDGQEANARVSFQVQPQDLENNAPPNPEQVEGRVFAGGGTSIDIPLDGIDPDGDSVTLVQLGTAPTLGTAKVRGSAIEYTAGREASGTDVFTYVVEDRLGARSTGTVMVGIAPLSTANNPPVAANDSITVRPGRPVSVDVLSNDTDPDGDRIALVDDLSAAEGVDARVADGRIVVTSPPEKGSLSVRYNATDGRGGTASATLTVQADPDAKLLAPIARDDRASLQETVGRDEVSLAVLDNDEDPDGRTDELEIALPDEPDTATVRDGVLSVRVQARAQVIAYTVTDVDGLSSTAFAHVPGSGEARPVLRSDTPLEIMAGETLPLRLDELVQVRDGHAPRLTGEDTVRSVPANDGPLVRSAAELSFRAAPDYAGPASVTVEVTDGTGPDDPEGLAAVLSIPITVLPRPEENRPPTLQSNSLEVAAGEDPARLDLRGTATDPDEGDAAKLVFRLAETNIQGVEVGLVDGHVLTASAPATTPKGTRGAVTVTVEDGSNPPVPATVAISVLASNRELPVAVDDTVPDAHQGRTETVDVLANDHNPYAGEGALRLVGATGTQGEGSAEVRGDRLAITPAESFVGTMTVQYTIGDITEDADREVDGTVTLNVKGRPEAPGLPRVESTGDRTVVLQWDAPANNGAPIEYYTVRGNGFEQRCESTTCTLTGLTNDATYTFSVTATNAVEESEPSAESAEARPDVEPEQPAPPTTTYGDREAAVAWTAPVSRGSPVTSYTLEISPAPAGGVTQVTGITGTGYTWEGLANGVSYQFRVQALNKADKPSPWSTYSAGVIPAGKPFQPSAPTAVRQDSAVDGGVVTVDWSAPDGNGAPLQGYALRVFEGGSPVRTLDVPGNTRSQTLTGLKTTGSYSFSVTARNKVGASPQSARSTAVTPYGRPLATGAPTATATGQNNRVRLDFRAPGANGSPITGYQYSTDGGAWQPIPGPGAVVATDANGSAHTWRVRALNAAGAGDPSPGSNSTSSYGPLRDGGGRSASHGDDWIDFRWNANQGAYANGRPVTLSVRVDGGYGSTPNDGDQRVGGLGYDTSRTLTVTATDSEGQTGSWRISETTNPAPPPPPDPKARLVSGPPVSEPGCTVSCYKLRVELSDFTDGHAGTWQADCFNSGRTNKFNNYANQVGVNGSTAQTLECWNGSGYRMPLTVRLTKGGLTVWTNDVHTWPTN
ncbi:Ig-like domain-containing protein [Arthrobacter halodurans]|uniref:Ig-like domain-containing protein n=1 Tax=Arthrobacter halodurans TaxID=516699 RepID=A0ABV4UNS2_9MICC